MDPILLLLIVLLLVGGGWGYRSDWGGPQYGGLVGVLLIIVLILFLTGHLGHGRL